MWIFFLNIWIIIGWKILKLHHTSQTIPFLTHITRKINTHKWPCLPRPFTRWQFMNYLNFVKFFNLLYIFCLAHDHVHGKKHGKQGNMMFYFFKLRKIVTPTNHVGIQDFQICCEQCLYLFSLVCFMNKISLMLPILEWIFFYSSTFVTFFICFPNLEFHNFLDS